VNFLHKDRLLDASRRDVFSLTLAGEIPAGGLLRYGRPNSSVSPCFPVKLRGRQTSVKPRPIAAGQRLSRPMRRALFGYLGGSSRVVIGPATGVIYRFNHPGARLPIDPRDAAAMLKLAALAAG